jgi:hypothetical protein
MRRITIILIALLFEITCHAQLTYTYDTAGNRIKREIPLKSGEIKRDSALASQPIIMEENTELKFLNPALEESFAEIQVKLYPNPTQGAVYVEFNHLPRGIMPELEIWGPTGRLIEKSKITGRITRINLWGKPGGIYFLKTILNEKPVAWKIIKE